MGGGGTSNDRRQIFTFKIHLCVLECFLDTWINLSRVHLVLPMLGGSLGLVEAGQTPVVPLIQPPALLHGEVCLSNLRQHGPE